ncbi:SCP2 sterol-binding domain-containing protein [Micromonospora schwarzwaldensis]|uniref:SCP2 sterol-binding domain-containing protein n=1 Tax=Micromonospora sp. DSM 45708 TaxID=3111767 RepID=UPI0031D950A6
MAINDTNPATMDPREFARLVKRTPTAELRQMMHSERRSVVLDELFSRMPGVFRADRARTLDAVIHWFVGDRPDGGVDTYEMVIAGGTCALSPAPRAEPDLTLALGAVDFLNLVTGNAHAVGLVMRGKLKTKGDLALTAKFPSLFDVPKP